MTRTPRATKAGRLYRLLGSTALILTVFEFSTGSLLQPALAQPQEPGLLTRYSDGTYTATGQYGNLPSFITVRLTLDDGIVTDVAVTPHATNPTSLDLQQRFAAAVPREVVGRPIADLEIGRLAGSSGTPVGFNAALVQIREQASSIGAASTSP